jgi:hypothetical protein
VEGTHKLHTKWNEYSQLNSLAKKGSGYSHHGHKIREQRGHLMGLTTFYKLEKYYVAEEINRKYHFDTNL